MFFSFVITIYSCNCHANIKAKGTPLMKLTKLQLKQIIQEELSGILEQEELSIETEENAIPDPDASRPPPSQTGRLPDKLREIAEELAMIARQIEGGNPSTANMYNFIAESLEKYSDILEQPPQALEGDEETQQSLEDSDYALRNLKSAGAGAAKKLAGTGSQLAGGW